MLPTYLLNPDSEAAHLAGTIELGLAEINRGIRSERSFKTMLAKYSRALSVRITSYSNESSTNVSLSYSSPIEVTDLVWQDHSQSLSNALQVEYV